MIAFIDDHREAHGVEPICKVLQIPYVVGKALWSRSIIEIVFALWAVLALARPAYPPFRLLLQVVPSFPMFLDAFEEALDGPAAPIVLQHLFGRSRGRLGQSRPLGKRAGFVYECVPTLHMERDGVPGPRVLHDRLAHGGRWRGRTDVQMSMMAAMDCPTLSPAASISRSPRWA